MAILTPFQITFDVSSLPAAVQTAITTLDADLGTAWGITENVRTLTYPWSALGGFSAAKLTGLTQLLGVYRARGWRCANVSRSNDQTTIRLVFELPVIQ